MPRSFVPSLTAQQRRVIGFPEPTSGYWTPETLAATSAMYSDNAVDRSGPESFGWLQPYLQGSASAPQSEAAAASGIDGVLTAAQLDAWREQGFVVAENLFGDAGLVPAAFAQIAASGDNLALGGRRGYPFSPHPHAANDLTLHPRLLGCVADLLGTRDIRLVRDTA